MPYKRKRPPRRDGGIAPAKGVVNRGSGRVGWPIEACINEYTPDVAEFMAGYDGPATARDVCVYLNISPKTFYDWYNNTPEFRELIDMLRDMADDAVEASLYKRATGFTHKTQKVARKVMNVPERDDEGEIIPGTEREIETERKITEEDVYVIPDTGAAKTWLAARRRDTWGERKVLEVHDHASLVEKFFRERMKDVTPEEGDDD